MPPRSNARKCACKPIHRQPEKPSHRLARLNPFSGCLSHPFQLKNVIHTTIHRQTAHHRRHRHRSRTRRRGRDSHFRQPAFAHRPSHHRRQNAQAAHRALHRFFRRTRQRHRQRHPALFRRPRQLHRRRRDRTARAWRANCAANAAQPLLATGRAHRRSRRIHQTRLFKQQAGPCPSRKRCRFN